MTAASDITITRGSVLVYRTIDVAEQVDLGAVEQLLGTRRRTTRLSLAQAASQAFIMRAPPLQIPLGTIAVTLRDQSVSARLAAKLWDYGGLSFQFEIPIPPATLIGDLARFASHAIRGFELEAIARQQAEEILGQIKPALVSPHEWLGVERYTIFFLEALEGIAHAGELLERVDLASLILCEPPATLAPRACAKVLDRTFQQGQNDLTVVDWHAAFVLEPSGEREIPDVIEFARAQLLELRYYDQLLDGHLARVQESMRGPQRGLLRSRFAPLSREASSRFIEFSHLVERLENSLKVMGDAYLACLFRSAVEEFRVHDWKESITRKLDLLGRTSELLQGELNAYRGHLLEIIVILLILFEIVSAVWKH
jgi:hypothetical protein